MSNKSAETATPIKQSRFNFKNLTRRPESGALAGTIIVYGFFVLFGGSEFTSTGGFATWLNTGAELLIIALPVGLLMIAGEFDLSVGSVVAASSVTTALVGGTWGLPTPIAVLVALGLGTLSGYLNGLMVTRTNVPSFIVTLAMQFALAGLTLGLVRVFTGTTSLPIAGDETTTKLFGGFFFDQFEYAIFWAIGVTLVVAWYFKRVSMETGFSHLAETPKVLAQRESRLKKPKLHYSWQQVSLHLLWE